MTLLIFLIVLSILIFVHELGHFIVAKRAGIKIEEFALGFPPRLWRKKIGETVYSLNWIPIGGFVRLYGEEAQVVKEQDRAFYHKGRLVRAFVAGAGVTMNFLLGVAVFSLIFAVQGIPQKTNQVKIIEVNPGAPAGQAGLKVEDIIVSMNNQAVSDTKAFREAVEKSKGQEINLTIARGAETFTVSVTPRENPPQNQGPLGVVVSSTVIVHPPFWQLPFVALWYGFKEAFLWVGNTVFGIGKALGQILGGTVPEDISGPVGIFQVTGAFAQMGISPLVWFVGVLSVNLAVINALPFPALDGGRLVFILIETVFGKRVVPAFERLVHTVGLIILLAFILLITLHDITRLFNGGFDFLKNVQ